MADTGHLQINGEPRKIVSARGASWSVDILAFQMPLKLMLQVGADSLAVGDAENRRLRMDRLKFGELPGFIEESGNC